MVAMTREFSKRAWLTPAEQRLYDRLTDQAIVLRDQLTALNQERHGLKMRATGRARGQYKPKENL